MLRYRVLLNFRLSEFCSTSPVPPFTSLSHIYMYMYIYSKYIYTHACTHTNILTHIHFSSYLWYKQYASKIYYMLYVYAWYRFYCIVICISYLVFSTLHSNCATLLNSVHIALHYELYFYLYFFYSQKPGGGRMLYYWLKTSQSFQPFLFASGIVVDFLNNFSSPLF